MLWEVCLPFDSLSKLCFVNRAIAMFPSTILAAMNSSVLIEISESVRWSWPGLHLNSLVPPACATLLCVLTHLLNYFN